MNIFQFILLLFLFSCSRISNKNYENRVRSSILSCNLNELEEFVDKDNITKLDSSKKAPIDYWIESTHHDKSILKFLLRIGAEVALSTLIGGTLANFLLNDLGLFNIFLDVIIELEKEAKQIGKEVVSQVFGKQYEIIRKGKNRKVYLLDEAENRAKAELVSKKAELKRYSDNSNKIASEVITKIGNIRAQLDRQDE